MKLDKFKKEILFKNSRKISTEQPRLSKNNELNIFYYKNNRKKIFLHLNYLKNISSAFFLFYLF
jgi:hypothetical protein